MKTEEVNVVERGAAGEAAVRNSGAIAVNDNAVAGFTGTVAAFGADVSLFTVRAFWSGTENAARFKERRFDKIDINFNFVKGAH